MSKIEVEGEAREMSLANKFKVMRSVHVTKVKWVLLEWKRYAGK